MIVQLVMNFIVEVLATVVSWIPPLPPTVLGWVQQGVDAIAGLAPAVHSTGAIIPWSAMAGAALMYATAVAFAGAVWLVRFIISLVAGGGGAS